MRCWLIELSNKPTDFLYQSAHYSVAPGKGNEGGQDGEWEKRQIQDREVKERKEKTENYTSILAYFEKKTKAAQEHN